MTYVFHRYGLHSEQSPLSRLHANWQHTVPAPFSLIAHYDHPIAYLVHVFLPMYLPAVLFRFHLLTYLLYLAVVSLEESLAYSGYNMLPSAFVLGGIARRQEKHLMGGGNGNYGCFGLLDFALGTSIGENLMNDVIDEAEETQAAKKTKGKAKVAGKKALKKAPKEKSDDEEEGEGEGGQADEDKEGGEEEEPPKSKRKSKSPKKSEDKGAEPHEDDTSGQSPEERNDSPRKRPSRIRKSEKKSSEEDAIGGAQDGDVKTEEQKPKPKAKGVTRKGSQKSKAGGRPKKRSEDDDS